MIFVKLWQFRSDDAEPVVQLPGDGVAVDLRPGVGASRLMFEGADERVIIEEWAPAAEIVIENSKGLELLVLEGSFTQESDRVERWSWLRLPAGQPLRAGVGVEGAQVWIKLAPLLHAAVCPVDVG